MQGGDGTVGYTWNIPGDFPDGGAWLTEGGFEPFAPFEGEGALVLAPGDVVTATMGGVTRTLTLIDVTADAPEVGATSLSGTAPLGADIGVFAHAYEDAGGVTQRWPVVQADGSWLADFAATPVETLGDYGRIDSFAPGDPFHIVAFEADGDETSLFRNVVEPPELYATTWPDAIIGGQGWTDTDLRIEIDGAGNGTIDFSGDLTVGTWQDRTYHNGEAFELAGPFVGETGTIEALAPGDVVTTTGLTGPQEGTVQQLTVQPVTIISVDRASGTITGTADPSVEVKVSRHGDDLGNDAEEVVVTADGDGKWTTKLATLTLWAGSTGAAMVGAESGTWTQALFGVPFLAAGIDSEGAGPDGDEIYSPYWYLDTTIEVTVTRGGDVVHGPELVSRRGDRWYSFSTSLTDLQVGDVVTATGQDSDTVASHTVVDLTVEWTPWAEDGSGNQVFGTTSAAPGSLVLVEVYEGDARFLAEVNTDGTWAADLDDLPAEMEPVQIGEDSHGIVSVLDADGHRTWAPWGAAVVGEDEEPGLSASATEQYVEGQAWFDDTSVNVSFADCALDAEVWPEDHASFSVGLHEADPDVCALEVGDTVTVTGTDSGKVRSLTITPLTVTAVDVDDSTVQGTADAGAEITVEAFGPEGPEAARTVTTQGDGTWVADFSTTIPDGEAWEQHFGTLGFTEETGGSASQQDEDGDRTVAEWRVLQPTLLVVPHHDTIALSDWPGDPVTVTIHSAGSAPELRLETTVTPEGASYAHELWLPLVFDLQPGQTVTADNGTTSRTMVVSTLTVDEFDFANATVAGLSDPDSEVFVVVQDGSSEQSTTATANSLGDWIAQFDTFDDAIEGAALVSGDFAHTLVRFVATYVGADLAPGDSVWSGGGDGPSEEDPLNIAVKVPEAGTVTLTETDAHGTVTGDWQIVGSKIDATSSITGTLTGPLELTIQLDASILGGATAQDLTIFRNDIAVPACPTTLETEDDFPCVHSRTDLDDGDVTIVVYTLELSTWHVATPYEATVVAGLGQIEVPEPTVPVGTGIQATAPFEGEVEGDVAATWTWGDGTDDTVQSGNAGSMVTATHLYDTPGIYTVTLEVGIGETTYWRTYRYVTVYDPSGAFVTGGGWFDSPVGAYPADDGVTGPAAFGFSVRYTKGSTTPVGDAEFTLEAGDLAFTATGYDWLVVPDDHHAQLAGSALVNEQSGYRFLLTATDPADGPDTLRMKVWEEAGGTLVYDNAIGTPDDAMVGTPLGGGQIVIHAPKPPKNAR